MGNQTSVPEKVLICAKTNDIAGLQSLIRDIQRQRKGTSALEFQDERQWTPLLTASAKGHHDCAELLARNGANVHHVTGRPDGTTALHECVARGHERVADLLLHYGASPFLENARGLTAIDVAINNRNVAMVRKLEARAQLQAMLLMKVPKWGGLGTEWRQRWVVIMPRYPSPVAPVGTERLVRTLLVAYKGRDQVVPTLKVWLDGAIARPVLGYKGSSNLQCALVLHRLHAAPTGAHITGDQGSGYTLHIRPADEQPAAAAVLRHFINVVNHRDGPPPGAQAPQAAPAAVGYPATPPAKVADPPLSVVASAGAGESDEELARRLQEYYNQEAGTPLSRPPKPAPQLQSHPLPATPTSSTELPNSTPPPMGPGPLQSSVAVHYPSIAGGIPAGGSTVSHTGGASQSPQAPDLKHNSTSQPATSAPSAPPMGASSMYPTIATPEVSWPGWFATLPSAPRPPAMAAATAGDGSAATPAQQPAAPSAPAVPSAPILADASPSKHNGKQPETALHTDFDDEDGMCVVCMEHPCEAGFLHGESVHKCCCRECARTIKQSQKTPLCPMCRSPIDGFIMNFY
ncbi:g7395 [Coccomyxa elongata]